MRALGIALAALLACSSAFAEPSPMAIVRPGGGFLVADGVSWVPLEIHYLAPDGAPGITGARVLAQHGKVTGTRIVAKDRLRFLYQAPDRRRGVDELLDVTLTMADGDLVVEAFPLSVPEPEPPRIELEVSPEVMDAANPGPIRLTARARTEERLEGLAIYADRGQLEPGHRGPVPGEPGPPDSGGSAPCAPPACEEADPSVRRGTLRPPSLPPDAPSYLNTAAVVSTARGFAVSARGIAVEAPVRISVQIPPGSELVVSGAQSAPAPVTAPADGRTVMEGVRVRYGAPIRIFERKGRVKKELSVALPTGVVAPGLVAPIPGQLVADGGTGPTAVVVIPPSPFGGKLFWPDITVEGARLVTTVELSERVRALVLERPSEPKTLRVLLDDQPAGALELGAARGERLDLTQAPQERDERGALLLSVRDASGALTDNPPPRGRSLSGHPLEVRRQGPGRYRLVVPPGSPGPPGDTGEVVAALEPPPLVLGDALRLPSARGVLTLAGPPPALRVPGAELPAPAPSPELAGLRFGLAASAFGGASLGSLLVLGGAVTADLRPPILGHRLALRSGLEFASAGGAGQVALSPDVALESRARVGGLLIPLEVGYAVLRSADFELLVHAGAALRFERANLDVGGDGAGGGSRTGLGARAGLEASLAAGDGSLFVGVTLDALGAGASGFSSPAVQFAGDLTQVRAEVGYRFWFGGEQCEGGDPRLTREAASSSCP